MDCQPNAKNNNPAAMDPIPHGDANKNNEDLPPDPPPDSDETNSIARRLVRLKNPVDGTVEYLTSKPALQRFKEGWRRDSCAADEIEAAIENYSSNMDFFYRPEVEEEEGDYYNGYKNVLQWFGEGRKYTKEDVRNELRRAVPTPRTPNPIEFVKSKGETDMVIDEVFNWELPLEDPIWAELEARDEKAGKVPWTMKEKMYLLCPTGFCRRGNSKAIKDMAQYPVISRTEDIH
ncbi:hypothetical protein BT63DRAFT_442836 [Microthyrium microscopicum]|uniref:Uncharacterized protein n=1 Tax=Microthyrium microscopicum TaxID=703497 RepID=A0A6A6U2T2_9PEZI|nr:hypothetical protein BT63DRAFT_442836 [Microthyrium microscopicum]